MKRLALAAALALAGCATTSLHSSPQVSEGEMRGTIAILSSDAFEGRMTGSAGEAKAAAYIAGRFAEAGLRAAYPDYLQAFPIVREPRPLPPESARLPLGQREFMAEMNRHPRTTGHNVVALAPGRRPDGRAVLVMAHYDHLGLCRPEGEADRICNGASDNASGVAAMLAVADRVGKMRLDRDVWFVATSGEEWGLLGAKAFAEHPPLSLGAIVAGFNLDTIAVAPRGMPVAMLAAPGTHLEPLVRAAAAALGRAYDRDDDANGFLKRQDGWALAEKGVPVIMAGGSFSDMARLEAYLAAGYHHPDDELTAATDLGGATEDANLHVELVRRAASRRLFPARH